MTGTNSQQEVARIVFNFKKRPLLVHLHITCFLVFYMKWKYKKETAAVKETNKWRSKRQHKKK